MEKRTILLILVAFGVLFAGCLGTSGNTSSDNQVMKFRDIAAPSETSEFLSSTSSSGFSQDSSSEKLVTKSGTVTIKVNQGTLENKLTSLKDTLKSSNADISSISYNEYTSRKQYSITIKINPEKFDSILESLKSIGELRSMDTNIEDVTTNYQDLDVKIKNRKIELERLYAIYNTTTVVTEILEVEREITRVEEELQWYEGQKIELERQIAKSTIIITLYEDKSPVESNLLLPIEQFGSVFFGAISASLILIVGGIGFLAPIVLVIFVLYKIYRKLRPKTMSETPKAKGK